MTDKDKKNILSFLLAGTLGGAGINIIARLANDLRDKYNEAELTKTLEEESKPVKVVKVGSSRAGRQDKETAIGTAAALLTLIGSGYAGYKAADMIGNFFKAKSVKKEEKEARLEYYKTLKKLSDLTKGEEDEPSYGSSYSSRKYASLGEKIGSNWALGLGIPLTLGALLMVATAANSIKASRKLNPVSTVGPENPRYGLQKSTYVPRKVVILSPEEIKEIEESEEIPEDIKSFVKDASESLPINELVGESILNVAIGLENDSEGEEETNSIGLKNVLNTYAAGEGAALEKIANSTEELFDICDQYGEQLKKTSFKPSQVQLEFAKTAMVNGKFGEGIVCLAARNIVDANPVNVSIDETFKKMASQGLIGKSDLVGLNILSAATVMSEKARIFKEAAENVSSNEKISPLEIFSKKASSNSDCATLEESFSVVSEIMNKYSEDQDAIKLRAEIGIKF